jgi:hypothetical protein
MASGFFGISWIPSFLRPARTLKLLSAMIARPTGPIAILEDFRKRHGLNITSMKRDWIPEKF